MSRWRAVVGFEGAYEVSFDGIVRSTNRIELVNNRWGQKMKRERKGQQIKIHHNKATGYFQACLKRNNKTVTRSVHKMVAEAFLPPKPEWADRINHKDSNRWNNVVTNLEWSNASLNALHYFAQPHSKRWSSRS